MLTKILVQHLFVTLLMQGDECRSRGARSHGGITARCWSFNPKKGSRPRWSARVDVATWPWGGSRRASLQAVTSPERSLVLVPPFRYRSGHLLP